MLDFLHTHHTGEDELLFPLLRERAELDPQLMERMDAQHAQVNDAVAAISAELPGWTTSADVTAGERMAARIDATMPTLIDHLAEEERKLLPIVSATLTQREPARHSRHCPVGLQADRRNDTPTDRSGRRGAAAEEAPIDGSRTRLAMCRCRNKIQFRGDQTFGFSVTGGQQHPLSGWSVLRATSYV